MHTKYNKWFLKNSWSTNNRRKKNISCSNWNEKGLLQIMKMPLRKERVSSYINFVFSQCYQRRQVKPKLQQSRCHLPNHRKGPLLPTSKRSANPKFHRPTKWGNQKKRRVYQNQKALRLTLKKPVRYVRVRIRSKRISMFFLMTSVFRGTWRRRRFRRRWPMTPWAQEMVVILHLPLLQPVNLQLRWVYDTPTKYGN